MWDDEMNHSTPYYYFLNARFTNRALTSVVLGDDFNIIPSEFIIRNDWLFYCAIVIYLLTLFSAELFILLVHIWNMKMQLRVVYWHFTHIHWDCHTKISFVYSLLSLSYNSHLHTPLTSPYHPWTTFHSRCLGADFLPFLPMVITKLLAAISQEVSFQTGEVDLEELEQR